MMRRSWLKRAVTGVAVLTATLFLMAILFVPVVVQAEGGIAISGSFYQQAFEIPQGSSISGPSIYVVVFNNGAAELKVRMTTQAPLGVNINLSPNGFTLPPGGQQQVLIGVEVTENASPGEYEISVTAESYKENVSGIQIAGAAGQNAKLTVLGESAMVTVQTESLDGQPIVSTVRLYRDVAEQRHEVAYSETGTLTAKVAPGSFIAVAYIGGEELDEKSFTVAANEQRTVILSGATVYFEGFGVVPNYYEDSGKLAFAQIVYTVRNLYKPVDKGEVILEVTRDNALLQEVCHWLP
jgi:type 1 fimbria pilin